MKTITVPLNIQLELSPENYAVITHAMAHSGESPEQFFTRGMFMNAIACLDGKPEYQEVVNFLREEVENK